MSAPEFPHQAYVALGSNLGAREATLQDAITHLRQQKQIAVGRVSSFLDTEPVGGPPDQPRYLNAALALTTALSPRELLDVLLNIEQQLGRDRSAQVRNAPRNIDLDLLLYDDLVLHEPGLELPHPRLHERLFVLQPLAEIAPDAAHPILRKTILELLRTLK